MKVVTKEPYIREYNCKTIIFATQENNDGNEIHIIEIYAEDGSIEIEEVTNINYIIR
jgi:hypothetical protein